MRLSLLDCLRHLISKYINSSLYSFNQQFFYHLLDVFITIDNNHKCVSRFADLTNYNLRFILNSTFCNLYCNVILYDLKVIYSIAQILDKICDELIVDVKLMNIINITNFKFVVIFFFEKHVTISF